MTSAKRALTEQSKPVASEGRANPTLRTDRPKLNAGMESAEMGLFDLGNSVRLKKRINEIAMFLCRPRRDVRDKIAKLERSGRTRRAHRRNRWQRPAGTDPGISTLTI